MQDRSLSGHAGLHSVVPVLPVGDAGISGTPGPAGAEPKLQPPLTDDQLLKDGYVSQIPWVDKPADCVVVCCSDHRFEKQNEDFVRALGFTSPHFVQVPSGIAVFHGLVAAAGFLPKAMGLLLDKAQDVTTAKTIIGLGHSDCGSYKLGSVKIVAEVARRLVGKDVREIQIEHLEQAGRAIALRLGGSAKVRVFYSDVVDTRDGSRVKYIPVDLGRHSRG
ncbi:MAG: hypothetical protein A3B30_03585 [Candidatus Komeilibacteria bacterium RIFCSPLOWO2_01_FULL_52_15]|uniref:Carbonic anhydrase n=1 Tax=Candidatus Komeilibacteria bacterium RIFCSPLOWO2_01_FULL_52_15 TaxID=1798551 RepID=A0A1G2BRE5_9BACT|nr:MAG: hypothetical protein A3B30_03585 [Candidatus Komeilibacteria bacterium RIFCSPLOWO2_01_FULL_52_15]